MPLHAVDFEKWKDRDFPAGSRARVRFEYLCIAGCDPGLLFSFLTRAVFSARHKRTIFEMYGVSRSAIVAFPDGLEQISLRLEAVNLGEAAQQTA